METSFTQKLQAANALLTQGNKKQASEIERWVLSLPLNEQEKAVNTLCVSKPGASLVNRLLTKNTIPAHLISYKSSVIMQKLIGRRKPLPVYNLAMEQEDARKKALTQKTKSAIANITRLQGDPTAGKSIFNSCMACHAIGDTGQQIAPALDGSKDRDLAHLITAIINPDEAVEAVYGLHYAVRKDGSYIEGYLKQSDKNGLTIAVMGGSQVFIPRHLLLHDGSIDGRSFMPSSYASLPAQTIADLAAYIKTIQ